MARLEVHESAGSSLADRYRVLLDVGRTLTGTLGLEDLYQAIYRETSRVLETAGFYISLYDAETDQATVVFFADRGREQRVDVRYRGSHSSVIRLARAVRVDDSLNENSLMLLGEGPKDVTRSAITAPLRWKDGVLGAISAQSYRPHAYTDGELELLQGIADLAAVAIENARQVDLLRRRTAEANEVEEIGRAMVSSLDPEDVLARVVDATVKLLDAHGAAVWMVTAGGSAQVQASRGELQLEEGLEWELPDTLVRLLTRDRRAVQIPDLSGSPLVAPGLRNYLSGGSGIGCALTVSDQLVGVLAAVSREGAGFSEDDAEVLERLASQASVALENARLHQSLQSLSLTDPLTGLPNRRHLDVHLQREVAAAKRGRDLVAIIFDLDNFKIFNDTRGHLAGDEALQAFARILSDENRAMNLVARYGGDEFVSILSDTGGEGAQAYIGRVRRRMATDPLLADSGISVSCGVASFVDGMERGADLLQTADQDLYAHKARRHSETD